MIKKWCKENTPRYSPRQIIDVCNGYLRSMDGSYLTKEQEYEIQNIYSKHHELMDFICVAFREKGYNEF